MEIEVQRGTNFFKKNLVARPRVQTRLLDLGVFMRLLPLQFSLIDYNNFFSNAYFGKERM